jgi:hypothetical protein
LGVARSSTPNAGRVREVAGEGKPAARLNAVTWERSATYAPGSLLTSSHAAAHASQGDRRANQLIRPATKSLVGPMRFEALVSSLCE